MNFLTSLLKGMIFDLPYFIEVDYSKKTKFLLLITYFRLSIMLGISKKIKEITEEKVMGYRITFFDYGTLHFLFREIFIRGEYFIKITSNKPIIIDCGANIGIATIYFKWLFPKSSILSFEPDPKTFKLLNKNISVNKLSNVKLVNAAVYNKNGKTSFFIDKNNPGWLTMSLLRERLPKDRIIVETVKLSDYIRGQTDLIKIDVEGVEYEVLIDLLKQKDNIMQLIIEYHHNIKNEKRKLSNFLSLIEKSSMAYNLSAKNNNLSNGGFQDITVYVQK